MYYDGGGMLLKREFSTGEYWEYAAIIHKNGQLYQMPTPERRAVYVSSSWQYEFFYTDHLGNTRVSFSAVGNSLTIKDISHFDPTGILLKDAGQINGTENRFLYQNKESLVLFGLSGVNDFSARYLDKTIGGRFWQVDPLADISRRFSTYSYGNNNPLRFIDPSGRESEEAKDFTYSDGYSTQSYRNSSGVVAVNGNYENADDSPNKRVILIGGANLSINGTDISDETEQIYKGIDKRKAFDIRAYNHPYILQTDNSFINDVVDEIVNQYTDGQTIIFYGYSKGGELALRIVRELDKKNIPVELLITVDAAESIWSNRIDRSVSENVKINYNIYQTDKKATLLESYGEKNVGNGHIINFNQTGMSYKKQRINHSNIDEANINTVIKWINDTLNK